MILTCTFKEKAMANHTGDGMNEVDRDAAIIKKMYAMSGDSKWIHEHSFSTPK